MNVRVTQGRIECFLDGESIVDQDTNKRRISVRDEVIPSKPLGIATYATTAEVRRILKRVPREASSGPRLNRSSTQPGAWPPRAARTASRASRQRLLTVLSEMSRSEAIVF